jgi:hypothetical protein
MNKVNMFETCARKELCKAECPSCNNDMCLGLTSDGKPCECYDTIRIINDASNK